MGVRFPWARADGPLLFAPLLIWGVVRFERVLPANQGHRGQVEPFAAITVSVLPQSTVELVSLILTPSAYRNPGGYPRVSRSLRSSPPIRQHLCDRT